MLVVVGLFGLAIGSFLNVVIARVPAGRSLAFPGSACPGCSAPLVCYDNIPVLSYLLLRGRCRSCGMRISRRYPIVESVTAILLVLAYAAFGNVPESWRVAAGLLAGGVALTSHGTKATTRAAANASPEPVSNSVLSVTEDGLAVFLAWLAASHPILTLILVALLAALSIYLLVRFFGYLRQVARRFFGRNWPPGSHSVPNGKAAPPVDRYGLPGPGS